MDEKNKQILIKVLFSRNLERSVQIEKIRQLIVTNDGIRNINVAINAELAQYLNEILENYEKKKISAKRFFRNITFNLNTKALFDVSLELGWDVNTPIGLEKKRLLHYAIKNHDHFIIGALFEIGADINVEDSSGNSCVSPLYQWIHQQGRSNISYFITFQMIYIHVQKLLALELYVSEKVQKCCIDLFEKYKVEKLRFANVSSAFRNLIDFSNLGEIYSAELKKMKLIRLCSNVSLFDVLLEHPHDLHKYANNNTFIKYVKENDQFPYYHFLLALQFRRSLLRRDLVMRAKMSLRKLIQIELPHPCSESIIQFLKSEDLYKLNDV